MRKRGKRRIILKGGGGKRNSDDTFLFKMIICNLSVSFFHDFNATELCWNKELRKKVMNDLYNDFMRLVRL